MNLQNEFLTNIHPELKGETIEDIPEEILPNLLAEFFMVIAQVLAEWSQ